MSREIIAQVIRGLGISKKEKEKEKLNTLLVIKRKSCLFHVVPVSSSSPSNKVIIGTSLNLNELTIAIPG